MDFLGLLREERAKAKAKTKSGEEEAGSSTETGPSLGQAEVDLERAYEGPTLPSLQFQDSLSTEPSLLYLDDAVSEIVASSLEGALGAPAQHSTELFTQLSSRLVAVFGKHPVQQHRDPPTPLPSWLSSLADELVRVGVFEAATKPNNVLVNSYSRSGGIDHHTDGPAYHPVVAILSLGGPMSLSFRTLLKTEEVGVLGVLEVSSALLMPRSLLVFRRELYHDHLHGIATDKESEVVGANTINRKNLGLEEGASVPRGPRISLTFRHVP
jgi:alkylated DNA repair protein alkB family protein 6